MKLFGSLLFFLLGWGILVLSCSRHPKIAKVSGLEYGGFMPSAQGQILAEAQAESHDSLLCKNKAEVLARDNMEALIHKVFLSFKNQWEQDTSLSRFPEVLPRFITHAEYHAIQKVESLNISLEIKKRMYYCKADVSLKAINMLDVIDSLASPDTLFYGELQKTKFFRKIEKESKVVFETPIDTLSSGDSTGIDTLLVDSLPPEDSSGLKK